MDYGGREDKELGEYVLNQWGTRLSSGRCELIISDTKCILNVYRAAGKQTDGLLPGAGKQVRNMIDEWHDMENRLAAVIRTTQNVTGSVGYWVDEITERNEMILCCT